MARDLTIGAGLPTPPKRPTGGLPSPPKFETTQKTYSRNMWLGQETGHNKRSLIRWKEPI